MNGLHFTLDQKPPAGMIAAEHRRTVFSQKSELKAFPAGSTLADIVSDFNTPPEFAEFGVVMLVEHLGQRSFGDVAKTAVVIERAKWHLVRPKPNAVVHLACDPGKGDALALIGMIALTALVLWAAPEAVGLFSPALQASGAARAIVAVGSAAVLAGGQVALGSLTKPPVGQPGSGVGPSLGAAGISQNPIGAFEPLPVVLGTMRVSPPLLTRSYTMVENNEQWVYMVGGIVGPCAIDSIKVNETAIADLPVNSYEIETREGWDDDDPLSIVTQSVFQENINEPMSVHRVDVDNKTLIEPYAASYPQPRVIRTARNIDAFRITLLFGSGMYTDGGGAVTISFRIRSRRVGDDTWVNHPEIVISAKRRAAMRQELWFFFGGSDQEAAAKAQYDPSNSRWNTSFAKNAEWTADDYFRTVPGGSAAPDTGVKNFYQGKDRLAFYLDSRTFPIDQYDFEITRSAEFSSGEVAVSATNYSGGMFTYTATGGGGTTHVLPDQSTKQAGTSIESYTSFRNQYPILEKGLALICAKFRNLQVNSVSAEFSSYVDGVTTSDPAALLKHVLVDLNPRPIDVGKIEDMSYWTDHCADKGLTCNALLTDHSVEKAANLVAACGDAIIRRADKWGVVIDKDRSDDPIVALFSPSNMTKPLTVKRNYLTAATARIIAPTFNDASQDYKVNQTTDLVYDDQYSPPADALVDTEQYDGLVTEALVTRRAKIDLRRARLRANVYSWEVHYSHLPRSKGDKCGIAHDILLFTYGFGRVKSWTESGGDLLTVTLDTDAEATPVPDASNIFSVEDVFTLSDIFSLTGVAVGLQIELATGTVTVIPISGVSGSTLTVDGTVGTPAQLAKGCMASVGRSGRESRNVIISSIKPSDDLYATIEAVDEASKIFDGF